MLRDRPQYLLCVAGMGRLSSLAPKQDAAVHGADIFLMLPYSLTPKHFKNTVSRGVHGCVRSRMVKNAAQLKLYSSFKHYDFFETCFLTLHVCVLVDVTTRVCV